MKKSTFILAIATMLILRMFWAAFVPLGNDEVYYWDWGRDIHLSYLDHPPGVAWLARLSSFFSDGALGARFVVPILHTVMTAGLCLLASLLAGRPLNDKEMFRVFFITQLVPIVSLGGFFLVPDAGLVLFLVILAILLIRQLPVPLLGFSQGSVAGIFAGLCGNFKYHALPVAGAMVGAFAIQRGRRGMFEPKYWFGFTIATLIAIAPVLLWNFQNDGASFRFQFQHGFSGEGLDLKKTLRFAVAQLVVYSPLMLIALFRSACAALKPKFGFKKQGTFILLAGFWPLAILLLYLSPRNQLLPHWTLPAVFCLLPLMVFSPFEKMRFWRANFIYCALLSCAVPTILAVTPLRKNLLSLMDYRPGALAELTLWPDLVDELQRSDWLSEMSQKSAPAHCPQQPMIASLRWFWTAHLAFALPGQPRVLNLDMNHPSFYDYRDNLQAFAGCEVLIIGSGRHWDEEALSQVVSFEKSGQLQVPTHLDTEVKIALGTIRKI